MTNLVKIQLDGKDIEAPAGSMVIEAAQSVGSYIPHFCYHKKLSIAANCRMCLVDIEKAPKPMPACATPVTEGMIVRTKSDKALRAQKAVMEFLLINHPLDCPICDQGGECQLQDLAVGYGSGLSRYEEEKRVVAPKEAGPLISMQEMSRCIQCTRCVRFGQEVAGVMEFGMSHRGEHSEIETFLGRGVQSELSGNMIDICPVGALTSKPFRYAARTWELSRRKSISPHDSTGANLIVQVKSDKVMRVLPLENEAVNECWIADRDRFSYEALNGPDRLTQPMIKQDGKWMETDWTTALEYVANGLDQIKREFGAQSIGTLASPHSTVEELYLAARFTRALGSDNIDSRLRHADFTGKNVHWLGMPIASLSDLDNVLVIGSDLRKDHPLFAARLRAATRKGAQIHVLHDASCDWAMPIANQRVIPAAQWLEAMREPAMKEWLASGSKKAILLGNAAAHHGQAEGLLAYAEDLAKACGAIVGYLIEAANTVGAGLVGARPIQDGLNAEDMLQGKLKAALLLNTEPAFDSAYGEAGLLAAKMVVSLSPFKANMDVADVMLPISPFTETSGSFVNAEGRLQSFYAVVRPLGQTRPAWKVWRVLAEMMRLEGFSFDSTQEVLQAALGTTQHGAFLSERLSNASSVSLLDFRASWEGKPCTASIYELDGLVRRAPSLQSTADGLAGRFRMEGAAQVHLPSQAQLQGQNNAAELGQAQQQEVAA